MKLICVFCSSIRVRILSPRLVHKAHLLNMFRDFAIGEIAPQMRVLKRVIIGEWNLVDMVGMYEIFFRFGSHTEVASHCLKGIKLLCL